MVFYGISDEYTAIYTYMWSADGVVLIGLMHTIDYVISYFLIPT